MRRHLVVWAVFAVVLSACSGQQPVPEDRYYRLPEASPPGAAALLNDGTIFVERFLADGIYQERAIAYSEGSKSSTVLQHHYSFWLDSPSRMLQAQLEDYLRKSNAAPLVTEDADGPASLSIFGRIRRLDRVLGSGSAQVQVALSFTVKTSSSDTPLLVKEYKADVNAAGSDMPSSIDAFGSAISRIFAQLVNDLHARLEQARE